MDVSNLRTLGRSGLLVSPLSLGTLTMGNSEWGSSDDDSETIFDAYLEAGGRSIDTADVYAGGRSEELIGRFIAERGVRDEVVLATKYAFNSDPKASASRPASPLLGGSSRKNLHRALEGSLRRLRTDHVDLYWMHVWDRVTPAEEVLQSLGELVTAGKIRYFGFSDVPAWFAVRAATLAEIHGVPGPIGLQLEYSLVERTIEHEHVPAACALGLGIVPWSPLAGGFLAGKYQRKNAGPDNGPNNDTVAGDGGRLSGDNPFGGSKFTDRNWDVLDAVREIAKETGGSPTEIALAWVLTQPGVATVLLGARTMSQLQDNLSSLEVQLTTDQLNRLAEASKPPPSFPSELNDAVVRATVFGGTTITTS